MIEVDVLIAGGGISGLTAARDLVRAGRRVRLLDARPRLGGVIATEQIDGFTIETGPDSLLMTKPAAAALCDELGLTLIPTLTPRTAFILRDGQLHAIPNGSVLGLPATPEAIEQATMLSPAGRARLARDLTEPAPARSADVAADESIGAVIRRRFGEEAVRYVAQPLLGGIHAGDVEHLSMRALFPRIAVLDREPGSLLAALAQPRREANGLFRTIPNGLSTLVDALARDLPADAIGVGTALARLDAPGDGQGERHAHGEHVATLSNGDIVRARAVILALPAYTIASLLTPLDPALATLCGEIAYSSAAIITLCYRREDVTHALNGTGFVVPRGERATRLLAASWVTSKWPNRAPADRIMMRAFAGGTLDSDLLDRDDDDLVKLTHDDLAPLLGLRTRPLLSQVNRLMRSGPQYDVGHLARVVAIEERLAGHPGLFVAGSAFRGIGIPDTVADARAVAEQVHRWLGVKALDKMSGA
jgi:protoporphyrinogen/coproporphyrinogen III oxidase